MNKVKSRKQEGYRKRRITLPSLSGEQVQKLFSPGRLKKLGLILTAISGAILSSTLTMPPLVLLLATVAGIAGSVLTILSQTTNPEAGKEGSRQQA